VVLSLSRLVSSLGCHLCPQPGFSLGFLSQNEFPLFFLKMSFPDDIVFLSPFSTDFSLCFFVSTARSSSSRKSLPTQHPDFPAVNLWFPFFPSIWTSFLVVSPPWPSFPPPLGARILPKPCSFSCLLQTFWPRFFFLTFRPVLPPLWASLFPFFYELLAKIFQISPLSLPPSFSFNALSVDFFKAAPF